MAHVAAAEAYKGDSVALDLTVASHKEGASTISSAAAQLSKAVKAYEQAAPNGGHAPLFVLFLPYRPALLKGDQVPDYAGAEASIQSAVAGEPSALQPLQSFAEQGWAGWKTQTNKWVRVMTSSTFYPPTMLVPSSAATAEAEKLYDIGSAVTSHSPYTKRAWAQVAVRICIAIAQACAPPLKGITCDCDNTLWGGAVGELGPSGVDVESARYRLVRAWLRNRARQGHVCALVSKNEASDVTSAFESIDPGTMGLSLGEHIAAVRASWEAKPGVLQYLCKDLALSEEHFAFVDDSPVECAAMGAQMPAVRTVQLPPPPRAKGASSSTTGSYGATGPDQSDHSPSSTDLSLAYSSSQHAVSVFLSAHPYMSIPYKSGTVLPYISTGGSSSSSSSSAGAASTDVAAAGRTSEDLRRTKLYQDMEKRTSARRQAPSRSAFLASLHLRIDVHRIEASTESLLPRAAQLTLRTNQLNIAKHPISLARLKSMVLHERQPDGTTTQASHSCFLADVTDRFGNYGLVAMALVRNEPVQLQLRSTGPISKSSSTAASSFGSALGASAIKGRCTVVDTFLMSCRVLERGVEHAMLRHIASVGLQQSPASGSKDLPKDPHSSGMQEEEDDWVCIPWVPADRNEPARQFLFDLVPKAVGRATADSSTEVYPPSSFRFVPVSLVERSSTDELVEQVAPKFFKDLVAHLRDAVRLMLDTMAAAGTVGDSIPRARELLGSQGGPLARFLIPERLVAMSRQTGEHMTTASTSKLDLYGGRVAGGEGDRQGKEALRSAASGAMAIPKHFIGIGAYQPQLKAAGEEAASSSSAAAPMPGRAASGKAAAPPISGDAAMDASRRAMLAVAATQVIKAVAPSLALSIARQLPVQSQESVAQDGDDESSVQAVGAGGESDETRSFMTAAAVETSLKLCLSVRQEESKWASSFAGGAEAGPPGSGGNSSKPGNSKKRKGGRGAYTGKVTRRLVEYRAPMSEIESAARAAKPPLGLVFVRRRALEMVRFDADEATTSAAGQESGAAAASSGLVYGMEEAASSRGSSGPHECGDGSLVWPPQAMFDLADACARGEASPLVQAVLESMGDASERGGEAIGAGAGAGISAGSAADAGATPSAERPRYAVAGVKRKRERTRVRQGAGPATGTGAGKGPGRDASGSGSGSGLHLSEGVEALMRTASTSARSALGAGGGVGARRAAGLEGGSGATAGAGAGAYEAETEAFYQLCRLRTAARGEAQALLKRARTSSCYGARTDGGADSSGEQA